MYEKYNNVWQRLGIFLGPILITIFISIKFTDLNFSWLAFLFWIHLPLIMIHETEEYVLSPISFEKFANYYTILSKDPPEENSPLSSAYKLFVNMSIWIWAILGALLVNIVPWVGMGLIIFQLLINGIQHTIIFQIKKPGYNPGFITTWLVLNPYCVLTIFYAYYIHALSSVEWLLALILGVGFIGILFAKTMSKREE
jgi:hypothetical protein